MSGLAQFGSQQVIDNLATNAFMVRTGDIDGDTDLDVVVPLFDDVVWYENLDGNANFGSQNSIVTGLGQSFSVDLADLDGDTDLDIIITSFDNDQLLWIENLDGLGTYGSPNIISNTVLGVQTAVAADLDGDTDMDIVCTSDEDDTIAWFENLDGSGTFGVKNIITSSVSGRDSFVGDLDGDNDMDVLTSANGIGKTLSWFENLDGLGTYSTEIIIANNDSGVEEVFMSDLDGDNDLDVLFVTPVQNLVAWHENLDGLGNFGSEQIITDGNGFVRAVFAVDLDNDDDIDVLSGSSVFGENISWYENTDGDGTFGPPQQIEGIEAAGIRSVFAEDLDGDTDNDVLGALLSENKVTWYENTTIAGVADNSLHYLKVYPNPVKEVLHVATGASTIQEIRIYDTLGRLLLEQKTSSQSIHIAQLPTGILFVEVTTHDGVGTEKVMKL